MVKYLGHVTIYFSTLSMYEVHAIQNVAVVEVKIIEGTLINQARAFKKTIHNMKKVVKKQSRKLRLGRRTNTDST